MNKKQEQYLVSDFQRGHYALKEDGDFGPKTSAHLDMLMLFDRVRERFSGTEYSNMMRVIGFASFDVGQGGSPGTNNVSPWIKRMREFCHFPADLTGPWCAIWASYIFKAYAEFPYLKLSRGAKQLVLNVIEYGEDHEAIARGTGDFLGIASYKREGGGHVRFVGRVDGQLFYLGGNERGDKVRWGMLTTKGFEKDLLRVGTVLV